MFSYEHDDSGEWLAAADAACLVLVRIGDSADGVARLWAALTAGASTAASNTAVAGSAVQGVLDELTSRGLSNTPPFAVVSWVGDLAGGTAIVRTIVRGDVDTRLETASGPVHVSGRGVSTWVEQSQSNVTALTLSVGSGEAAGPGPLGTPVLLPLIAGTVRTRRLSTAAAARVSAVPEAVPEETIIDDTVAAATVAESTVAESTVSESAVSESAVAESTVAEFTVAELDDGLFGATMMRPTEAMIDPASDTLIDPDTGDHDGLTIMSGDIQKLRDSRRRPARATGGAEVAAPPSAPQLSLLLPNGSRELLTQPVLVGRSPSVSKVSGGQVPRLVSLGSTDQDISRNHVQFQVEGDTVVVTDLHSRNGTIVVLPGKPPQKLRQGEPTSVIVGTVVDLGNGVTLTVCED